MLNLKLKKIPLLISLATLATISGCATIPDSRDISTYSINDAEDKVRTTDQWLQDPAIRVVYSNVGTQVRQKEAIPNNINNLDVDISMVPNSTMDDFLTGLSSILGVSTISETEEIGNMKVYVPHFSGKLGDLLQTIALTKDISFGYSGNSIILKEASSYMITLPQDSNLLENVKLELEAIGARNVSVSVNSGIIFYDTTLKNQDRIETYLDRITNNSALITLQVMVINVNTERDRKSGFDWSSFQAKIGDLGVISSESDSGGNGGGIGGVGDGSSGESSEINRGAAGSITGSALGINLSRGSVDITGLFNLLSTYGKTTTNQDVSLKTISGKEVIIDSFQEIPYVSDVNLSTTDTGVSNSGLDTDTAKNGLTMNFLPFYEADSQLVSIDIDIQLETLLGFVELSAGNQFGTITQPRTQRQAFNNTIRTPVGESVILGGITYESISDNNSTISPLDAIRSASESYNLTTNSLFIVIRPTVVLYRQNQDGR